MANLVQFINSKHEGKHSNISNAENTDTIKTIVFREELSNEEKTLLENLPLFKEMKAEMSNIHELLSLRSTIAKIQENLNSLKNIEPSLDKVIKVSEITTDISAVSENIDSVNKVAQASISGLLENIARHINEIIHVYGMSEAIGVLNNISYKLERLYKSIDNVDSVSGHLSKIDEVSQHLLAIEIVARYYGVLEDIQEVIPELKNLADIKQDLIDFRNNRVETKEVIKAYKEAGQIVQRTIDDAVAKLEERVKKFDPESIKKLDEEMTTLKSSITTIQSTIETKFTEIDGVVANKLTPMQESLKELKDKLSSEVNKLENNITQLNKGQYQLLTALNEKLDKTETAVNSDKLGGLLPEKYVKQDEVQSGNGKIPRLNANILTIPQVAITGSPEIPSTTQANTLNFYVRTLDSFQPTKYVTYNTLAEHLKKDIKPEGYWEKERNITKPYAIKENEAIIKLDPVVEDELIVDGELYIEGTTTDLEEKDGFQAGQYGFFAMKNPKGRWLFCDGREISREAYPDLFEAIGTTYGEGDGTTTFNIPDRRGYFGRCLDAGAEVDYQSDREIGSKQGDAIRNITGSLNSRYSGYLYTFYNESSGAFTLAEEAGWSFERSNSKYTGAATSFDASRVVPTAPENVVKNIAEYVCIRY